MRIKITSLALVLTLFASYIFSISPLQEKFVDYLAASLIRAEGDVNVYYVKDGKRHWIDSPELFKAHALPWKEVQVLPRGDITKYEEGERVDEQSTVILPGEEELLPDLVVFPPRELHLKENKSRLLLLFSTTAWNKGKGPLELLPGKASIIDGEELIDVFNRVYRKNGEYRDKLVGNFKWHDARGHNHYHLNDFADYTLDLIDGASGIPTMKEKTSFCVLDEIKVNLSLRGAPKIAQFPKCPKSRQGLSVGWGDDYEYDLAGQNFDITDFAPGIYRLTFEVNPRNRFVESRADNNKSFAIVRLDPQNKKFEVIVTTAAFEGASAFANGSLLRSEKDGRVYMIHNNKKRLLRGEEAVNLYRSLIGILDAPESILEVLPYGNLVRANDGKVYALNDFGYKRHIQNAEIFESYNLSWADVADISAKELEFYKDSRVVRVDGEGTFYHINGNILEQISYIDAFYTNGFSKEEVQIINRTDFQTYKIGEGVIGAIE